MVDVWTRFASVLRRRRVVRCPLVPPRPCDGCEALERGRISVGATRRTFFGTVFAVLLARFTRRLVCLARHFLALW